MASAAETGCAPAFVRCMRCQMPNIFAGEAPAQIVLRKNLLTAHQRAPQRVGRRTT